MAKSNATSFSSRFIGAVVKPGQKVYSSSRPELIAASTKDKFIVNDRAADMLGVKTGDKIFFVDLAMLNAQLPKEEQVMYPRGERFFVAVNYRSVETGEIEGGLLSKQRVFSYSRVWSAIHMDDPEIVAARPEDMIQKGIAVSRGKGKAGCIATQKVHFELELLTDEDGNDMHVIEEGGEPTRLYKLINPVVAEHDPNVEEELS